MGEYDLTVQELTTRLQEFPPEFPVLVWDGQQWEHLVSFRARLAPTAPCQVLCAECGATVRLTGYTEIDRDDVAANACVIGRAIYD